MPRQKVVITATQESTSLRTSNIWLCEQTRTNTELDESWNQWTECAATTTLTMRWTGWLRDAHWEVENCTTWRDESHNRTRHIPPITPERQAELDAAREQREAAESAAMTILRKYLTPEQDEALRTLARIPVRGSAGGLYHLRPPMGVRRVEGDTEVEALCCHADPAFPEGDHLLTQKLWLEANEPEFRKIANITRIHEPLQAPRAA